jgi:hypothetical protein
LLLVAELEVGQGVQYHPLLREYHTAEQEYVMSALHKHCRQLPLGAKRSSEYSG